MGAAIATLWAFLSSSIQAERVVRDEAFAQERRIRDETLTALRTELDTCEKKHEDAQQGMRELTGKVNAVIGHNEGYLAARAELQGFSSSLQSIDESLKELSEDVLKAIHQKE